VNITAAAEVVKTASADFTAASDAALQSKSSMEAASQTVDTASKQIKAAGDGVAGLDLKSTTDSLTAATEAANSAASSFQGASSGATDAANQAGQAGSAAGDAAKAATEAAAAANAAAEAAKAAADKAAKAAATPLPAPVAVAKPVAEPKPAPAPAPVVEAPQQKSAYFRINSTAPLERATGDLQELAEWASTSGNKLGLTGFTDGTGNQAINEQLAKERAEAIRDLLVGLGVPAGNVEMIEPQAVEAAPGESWRARRVDVVPVQ